MWTKSLWQVFLDLAQSEQVSRPIRITCIVLLSLGFLICIAGLSLLVFADETQSPFRKGVFLIIGIAILACYLQFLNTIMRRRKDGTKRG